MRSAFGVTSLLSLIAGFATLAIAPSISQEMAGLNMLLISVVAGGFYKIIGLLEARGEHDAESD